MVSPLLFLSASTVLSVLLFLKGFFLARRELMNISSPSDFTTEPLLQPYDRAVLIIIDALRYDMVSGRDTNSERECSAVGPSYCGQLQLPRALHQRYPAASRLFKFRADPPTSTVPRLRGLITGGLPTFIEVGQSFSAGALQEDSLIAQLKNAGRAAAFVGDDTWSQLFPADHWSFAHPLPSLDVRDLETVDRGVMSTLPGLISSQSLRHSGLLVGHMLGIDHVGHLHNINHPEMARKLREADGFLESVVRQVERESGSGLRTLILVLGDHGQTVTGDHGGGSPEETDSVLWAFDPSLALAHSNASRLALDRPSPPQSFPLLSQLDFTASVSSVLGLPLPFSNLGKISPDLFSLGGRGKGDDAASQRDLSTALLRNARQVVRYLTTYVSEGGSFDKAAVRELQYALGLLEAQCSRTAEGGNCSERALGLLQQAADLGRRQFTQFNDWFMSLAFLVLVATFTYSLFTSTTPLSFALRGSFSTSQTLPRLLSLIPSHPISFLCVVLTFVQCFGVLSDNYILYEPVVHSAFISVLLALCLLFNPSFPRASLLSLFAINQCIAYIGRIDEPISWNPFDHRRNNYKSPRRWEDLVIAVLNLSPRTRVHALAFLRSLSCSAVGVGSALITAQQTHPSTPAFFAHLGTTLLSHALAGSYDYILTLHEGGHGSTSLSSPPDSSSSAFVSLKQLELWLPRAALCLSIVVLLTHMLNKRPIKSALFSLLTLSLALVARGPGILVLPLSVFFLLLLSRHPSLSSSVSFVPLLSFASGLWFFAQGHRCEFQGLQYASAYVGLEGYDPIFSAISLALNTFAPHILIASFLPFVLTADRRISGKDRPALYYYIWTRQIWLFGSLLCGSFHRRHLMIWGLFAPRLLFECCFAVVSTVVLALSVIG